MSLPQRSAVNKLVTIRDVAPVYVICPRCGLSIAQRFSAQQVRHCPRCIAHRHVVVELFSSPLPSEALYANVPQPVRPPSSTAAPPPSKRERYPPTRPGRRLARVAGRPAFPAEWTARIPAHRSAGGDGR
jgi:hypothetical protein